MVKNENEVEKFFFDRSASYHALGAVVFYEKSFKGDRVRRNATVRYKIRLRAEQYSGTYQLIQNLHRSIYTTELWLTESVFSTYFGPAYGGVYGGPLPGEDKQRSHQRCR